MANNRTRVIFQNPNLFVGPAALSGSTATGALYTSGNSGNNLIAQISRVQNATLNVSLNRQDVNQFGQLNRIDALMINPPTISLDFSYYSTNGYNEYLLGMNAKGGSLLSGIQTKVSDSKNYFLAVSPQGIDDIGYAGTDRDVYAIGNGFISNYTFNAAVGQLPTASVTVDALNIESYTTSSGNQTPAVNTETSQRITDWTFQLPVGNSITGNGIVSALRPGDISLSFPSAAGFLSSLSGDNRAHIQSVSLSVPISREVLNELGSFYGYSREIQFPVNASMSIRGLATNALPTGFSSLLCNDQFFDLALTVRQPSCGGTGNAAVVYKFNQAKVTNWSNGYSIGGNSTLDLTLTSQLAGANSLNGITLSGSY